MLKCSVCEKEVRQSEDGGLVRECEHLDAAVVAELSAHATGVGSCDNDA